jgi:hypothetical protein
MARVAHKCHKLSSENDDIDDKCDILPSNSDKLCHIFGGNVMTACAAAAAAAK